MHFDLKLTNTLLGITISPSKTPFLCVVFYKNSKKKVQKRCFHDENKKYL